MTDALGRKRAAGQSSRDPGLSSLPGEYAADSASRHAGLVKVLLAVNGGLMRGLKVSGHLTDVNATFVADARTAPEYRMWSINDDYPAMLRVRDNSGRSIAVEIWSVTPESLVKVFFGEPHGLSLGWVALADGTKTIGVLAEADLVEGQREITDYGGWRAYTEAEGIPG
jgi:hypothetical protein